MKSQVGSPSQREEKLINDASGLFSQEKDEKKPTFGGE
jgi:hypothetical protein